jgi:hypothetical protein
VALSEYYIPTPPPTPIKPSLTPGQLDNRNTPIPDKRKKHPSEPPTVKIIALIITCLYFTVRYLLHK